ncbi:unnamed protein product [Chrysoparadoxa australica]
MLRSRTHLDVSLKRQVIDTCLKQEGVGCLLSWIENRVLMDEKTCNVQYVTELISELAARQVLSKELSPGLHQEPEASLGIDNGDDHHRRLQSALNSLLSHDNSGLLVKARLERVTSSDDKVGVAAATALSLIRLSKKGLTAWEIIRILDSRKAGKREKPKKRTGKATDTEAFTPPNFGWLDWEVLWEQIEPFCANVFGKYVLRGHLQSSAVDKVLLRQEQPPEPAPAENSKMDLMQALGQLHSHGGRYLVMLEAYFSEILPSVRKAEELPAVWMKLIRAAHENGWDARRLGRCRERLHAVLCDSATFDLLYDPSMCSASDTIEAFAAAVQAPEVTAAALIASFEARFNLGKSKKFAHNYQLYAASRTSQAAQWLSNQGGASLLRIGKFMQKSLQLNAQAERAVESAICLFFKIPSFQQESFANICTAPSNEVMLVESLQCLAELYWQRASDMYELLFEKGLEPDVFKDLTPAIPMHHVKPLELPDDAKHAQDGSAAVSQTSRWRSRGLRGMMVAIKMSKSLGSASKHAALLKEAHKNNKLKLDGVIRSVGLAGHDVVKAVNPGVLTRQEIENHMKGRQMVDEMMSEWPKVVLKMGLVSDQAVKLRNVVQVQGEAHRDKVKHRRHNRLMEGIYMQGARFGRLCEMMRNKHQERINCIAGRKEHRLHFATTAAMEKGLHRPGASPQKNTAL